MRVFHWPVCGESAAASAQTVTSASVTGTVRDSSNAVIPGATVEIVNAETNQRQQTITDAHGRFRLLYLAVGPYQLSVQLSWFRFRAHRVHLEGRRSGRRTDRDAGGRRDGSGAGRSACADRRSTTDRRLPPP